MNPYMKKLIQTVVVGLLIIPVFMLTWINPAFCKNEFVPWENGVFAKVGKKHGDAAALRLRKGHDFIVANQFKLVKG